MTLNRQLESVSVLPMRLLDNWPEGLFGIGSPEESKQETVYPMSDGSSEIVTMSSQKTYRSGLFGFRVGHKQTHR